MAEKEEQLIARALDGIRIDRWRAAQRLRGGCVDRRARQQANLRGERSRSTPRQPRERTGAREAEAPIAREERATMRGGWRAQQT